jgi:hypothetical protein
MNFGDGCCKKCCWWHHGADERKMDGSQSKIGPRRQPGYVWNAESKSTRFVWGGCAGSTVKRNEIRN